MDDAQSKALDEAQIKALDEAQSKAPDDKRAADLKFNNTPVGQKLLRFINAHGRAWVADSTPYGSDRKLHEAWRQAEAALAELKDEIRKLLPREDVVFVAGVPLDRSPAPEDGR